MHNPVSLLNEEKLKRTETVFPGLLYSTSGMPNICTAD